MVWLLAVEGPGAGRGYALGTRECVLGRAPGCDVKLEDHRISRRHARILRTAAGWVLEDLGSVNGTYLNGRRLAGPAPLQGGDEIGVGAARLRVQSAEAEGEQARAPGERVTVVDAEGPDTDVLEVANLRPHDALHADAASEGAREPLERKLRAMYRVSEAVASALEPRALLERVVAQLLEVFPQAANASAVVLDARAHALRTLAARSRDGADAGAPALPAPVVDRVLRQGRSVLLRVADSVSHPGLPGERITAVSGPPAGMRGAGPSGFRMGAPLSFNDEPLGILHVEASPERGAFDQADLDLLGGIAAQAGVALHLAGVHQRLLLQDRLEKDLAIARQIQRSLLPREPPRVTGLEFAAHYEPAYRVGGDFFDYLWLGPSRLGVLVGDVSGKAVSGALFMARVASEFRAAAPLEPDPRRLFERVNDAVVDVAEDGMFCTALLLTVDLERHVARLVNAGHTAPLLRRGDTVRVVDRDRARARPLGVDGALGAGQLELALRPGDVLVLCTDGVLEARGEDGGFYGPERLSAAVAAAPAHSARAVLDAVLADVERFAGERAHGDDLTLLCVRVTAPSSRRG